LSKAFLLKPVSPFAVPLIVDHQHFCSARDRLDYLQITYLLTYLLRLAISPWLHA